MSGWQQDARTDQRASTLADTREVNRHPAATVVLVLGIAALFLPLLGPVAWIKGNRVARAAIAEGLEGRVAATAGRNLGVLATALLIVVIAIALLGGEPIDPNGL